MRFYAGGYNIELNVGRDEPSKSFSALCILKCNLDDEDVQYGPDDLPIKKPLKTLASFSKDSLKAPSSSLKDPSKKISDPASQMTIGPSAVEATNAQTSPPRDVVTADLTVEAARNSSYHHRS